MIWHPSFILDATTCPRRLESCAPPVLRRTVKLPGPPSTTKSLDVGASLKPMYQVSQLCTMTPLRGGLRGPR